MLVKEKLKELGMCDCGAIYTLYHRNGVAPKFKPTTTDIEKQQKEYATWAENLEVMCTGKPRNKKGETRRCTNTMTVKNFNRATDLMRKARKVRDTEAAKAKAK